MENINSVLSSIIKVQKASSEHAVNSLLSAGWILLNVHTEDYGHPVERHQTTWYSLGWSKDNGEIIDPIEEEQQQKADYYNQFIVK